jgi:hypothetical protein
MGTDAMMPSQFRRGVRHDESFMDGVRTIEDDRGAHSVGAYSTGCAGRSTEQPLGAVR